MAVRRQADGVKTGQPLIRLPEECSVIGKQSGCAKNLLILFEQRWRGVFAIDHSQKSSIDGVDQIAFGPEQAAIFGSQRCRLRKPGKQINQPSDGRDRRAYSERLESFERERRAASTEHVSFPSSDVPDNAARRRIDEQIRRQMRAVSERQSGNPILSKDRLNQRRSFADSVPGRVGLEECDIGSCVDFPANDDTLDHRPFGIGTQRRASHERSIRRV